MYNCRLKINANTTFLNRFSKLTFEYETQKVISILISSAKSAIATKWKNSKNLILKLWH